MSIWLFLSQLCNSNSWFSKSFCSVFIGSWLLFCIASHKVIALLSQQRQLSLLRETVKSNGKHFAIASKKVERAKNITFTIVGEANGNQENKQRTNTKNQAKSTKSDNFTRNNRENSILLQLYWENDRTKSISYLGAPIIFSPTIQVLCVCVSFINFK